MAPDAPLTKEEIGVVIEGALGPYLDLAFSKDVKEAMEASLEDAFFVDFASVVLCSGCGNLHIEIGGEDEGFHLIITMAKVKVELH